MSHTTPDIQEFVDSQEGKYCWKELKYSWWVREVAYHTFKMSQKFCTHRVCIETVALDLHFAVTLLKFDNLTIPTFCVINKKMAVCKVEWRSFKMSIWRPQRFVSVCGAKKKIVFFATLIHFRQKNDGLNSWLPYFKIFICIAQRRQSHNIANTQIVLFTAKAIGTVILSNFESVIAAIET